MQPSLLPARMNDTSTCDGASRSPKPTRPCEGGRECVSIAPANPHHADLAAACPLPAESTVTPSRPRLSTHHFCPRCPPPSAATVAHRLVQARRPDRGKSGIEQSREDCSPRHAEGDVQCSAASTASQHITDPSPSCIGREHRTVSALQASKDRAESAASQID